jgi:type VI protein secretion system component VasK
MSLYNIATAAADHLAGRFLRRALLALAMAALAIVAIYHFTVAGTLVLETYFSALHAQLIVAGIYTALAIGSYTILWATGRRNAKTHAPMLSQQREKQLTTLVEAAMVGFELARKGTRSR